MNPIEYLTNSNSLKLKVDEFIKEWNSSSTCINVTTSGSTGSPKLIEINKEFMINSAKMTGEFLQLKKGDSALLCLSTDTIAGKMMVVRSITLGLRLFVTDISSAPLSMVNEQIDFAAMVPLQVQNSINNDHDKFNNISKVIIGGGVISSKLKLAISSCSNQCFQTFGMTETVSHIAMRRINTDLKPYTVLPGVQVASQDSSLVINAPSLGVHNLKTNDIIDLHHENSFTWLGRKDFVINSGGIKINPETIEEKIDDLIESHFFSYGIYDEELGQKHVLCIEGVELNFSLDELRSRFDKYITPKEIFLFEEFEFTNSGKIDRLKTIEKIASAKKQVL